MLEDTEEDGGVKEQELVPAELHAARAVSLGLERGRRAGGGGPQVRPRREEL